MSFGHTTLYPQSPRFWKCQVSQPPQLPVHSPETWASMIHGATFSFDHLVVKAPAGPLLSGYDPASYARGLVLVAKHAGEKVRE